MKRLSDVMDSTENYIKSPSVYGYIREEDCRIAELHDGFTWHKIRTPKLDFLGRPFTHILCRTGYMDHVLEPDTRVPNYTTSFIDAAKLAWDMSLKTDDLHQELLNRINAL